MKICNCCKQKKPPEDFAIDWKDQRKRRCKTCYAMLQRIKMKYRKIYAKGKDNG